MCRGLFGSAILNPRLRRTWLKYYLGRTVPLRQFTHTHTPTLPFLFFFFLSFWCLCITSPLVHREKDQMYCILCADVLHSIYTCIFLSEITKEPYQESRNKASFSPESWWGRKWYGAGAGAAVIWITVLLPLGGGWVIYGKFRHV